MGSERRSEEEIQKIRELFLLLASAVDADPEDRLRYRDVKDAYGEDEWEAYCQTMKNNVLAEYCGDIIECRFGLQVKARKAHPALVSRTKFRAGKALILEDTNMKIDLRNLKDNIIRSEETKKFYWISRAEEVPPEDSEDDGASSTSRSGVNDNGASSTSQSGVNDNNEGCFSVLVRGCGLSGKPRSSQPGFSDSTIRLEDVEYDTFSLVCFAGDYANRYRSADFIQHNPHIVPYGLRSQILDARRTMKGSYDDRHTSPRSSASSSRWHDLSVTRVNLNEKQKEAVMSLTDRVTIVQGPPGTGKSTTIASMIVKQIKVTAEDESKAVVTAVTNQAINAVSEKLKNAKIPFLVLGSDRIGETASKFTLEALVASDEYTSALQKASDNLKRYARALDAVQYARVSAFCGAREEMDEDIRPYVPREGAYHRHPHLRERAEKEAMLIWKDCAHGNLHGIAYPQCSHEVSDILVSARVDDEDVKIFQNIYAQNSSSKFGISHVRTIGLHYMMLELVNRRLSVRIDKTRRKIARAYVWTFGIPRKIVDAFRSQLGPRKKDGHRPWRDRWIPPPPRNIGKWPIGQLHEHVIAAEKMCNVSLGWAKFSAEDRAVRDASAILVTIGSSHRLHQFKCDHSHHFHEEIKMAILDEAGATAETYIPMLLDLKVQNLVLVGDQKQLPPLIKGAGNWYDSSNVARSLMQRSIERNPKFVMLKTQYRMPRMLCDIVSDTFYDGELETGECAPVISLQPPSHIHLPSSPCKSIFHLPSSPCNHHLPRKTGGGDDGRLQGTKNGSSNEIRFYDVHDHEVRIDTGYVNEHQAYVVVGLLENFSEKDSVMIICLYKKQVRLLEPVVEKYPSWRLITVDAAQGSEADHVILCTVRSNPEGRMGFVTDQRRLNVAISRAKRSFSIVGDYRTLRLDPTWALILDRLPIVSPHMSVPDPARFLELKPKKEALVDKLEYMKSVSLTTSSSSSSLPRSTHPPWMKKGNLERRGSGASTRERTEDENENEHEYWSSTNWSWGAMTSSYEDEKWDKKNGTSMKNWYKGWQRSRARNQWTGAPA